MSGSLRRPSPAAEERAGAAGIAALVAVGLIAATVAIVAIGAVVMFSRPLRWALRWGPRLFRLLRFLRVLLLPLALGLAGLGLSACCCGDWPEASGSADAGERAGNKPEDGARVYLQEHLEELLADRDAGPPRGGGGGCLQMLMTVALAVLSRGHAGGDPAYQVGGGGGGGCGLTFLVTVALSDELWRGIGAVVFDAEGAELGTVGDPSAYEMTQRVTPGGVGTSGSGSGGGHHHRRHHHHHHHF